MSLSFDVFNSLVLFLLKAAFVLLLVRWLVEQSRDISAASARSLLAVFAVLLCFVPLVTPALPVLRVPLIPPVFAHWLHVPLAERTGDIISYNGVFLAAVSAYVLVAAWQLFYILAGVIQVVNISRRGRECGESRLLSVADTVAEQLRLTCVPLIKVSDEVVSPQVWGWRRPVVLLPGASLQWPEGRLRRVLIHELAHIKRQDWLIKMLLHYVSAVLWFVPFMAATVKRSAWYAELACDDCVVRLEGERAAYAKDLLCVSRGSTGAAVVALIDQSSVYRRVRAVLDGTRNRAPATVLERAQHVGLACLLLLPLASVQAVVRDMPAISERAVEPLKLIINLPAPGPRFVDPPADNAGFRPEQLGLLRRRPANPPAVEEVVTVGHLLDYEPVIMRPQHLPQLSMAIDPAVAIQGPEKRVTVAPRYPRNALVRGIEGRVVVRFNVGTSGEVFNPTVVRSEPDKVFDQAVLQAVRQFKYRPQQVDGQFIITKNITETFVFQVSNGTSDNQTQPHPQLPAVTP